MTTYPIAHYAHAIRPSLPAAAFRPVPSRLAWLALHVATIVGGILALHRGVGGAIATPFWSLLIGNAFAGCAFVGHETLHGAVVRNRLARHLIGWLCFVPFTLSPHLWVAWHNKVHHGNTMIDGVDPDAFPTLATYRTSRTARIADHVAAGHGRWLGFLSFLIGFTGQSMQMLLRWSRTTTALTRRQRVFMIVEAVADVAVWVAVGILVGPRLFLFAYVFPLMVGNAIVMGYILTNHNLNPLVEANDPLLSSLTVEVPELIDRLHLRFSLHVEHHIFPSMSSAYAPLVRAELMRRFPERYQSLPLGVAWRRLWETPRVYVAATRLIDPLSGLEADTLLPLERPEAAAFVIAPRAAA